MRLISSVALFSFVLVPGFGVFSKVKSCPYPIGNKRVWQLGVYKSLLVLGRLASSVVLDSRFHPTSL